MSGAMRVFSVAILFFVLASCVSAEQKSASQWEVKTTTASQQKIWVVKPDGSRQCEGRKGVPTPEVAAEQLKRAGILVFQAKAGSDGRMRAQKCGASTGATLEIEISRADLRKALELGFIPKAGASE